MHEEAQSLPWYRYFWPWFIVGLLATSVVAGLSTVVIAVQNADSLVRDDWYKEGTAINRRIADEQLAIALGVRARLQVDASAGLLTVDLEGTGIDTITHLLLEMSHPTQSAKDHGVVLARGSNAPGRFEGATEVQLDGRWYATLTPVATTGADRAAWRVATTLLLPQSEVVSFGSEAPPSANLGGRP